MMKPCGDCPFRKASLRGWLGTFESPEELRRMAVSEEPMSCHSATDDAQTVFGDITETQCVGRLLFAAKSAKRFRHPVLAQMQKDVERINDKDAILGMLELCDHHKPTTKEEFQNV